MFRSLRLSTVLLLCFLAGNTLGESEMPSEAPTFTPTRSPTPAPTVPPTRNPTARPSRRPSRNPTDQPTRRPTTEPTLRPTLNPTAVPTTKPTGTPTLQPTPAPTRGPTSPSLPPTPRPTKLPTPTPTFAPVAPVPVFPDSGSQIVAIQATPAPVGQTTFGDLVLGPGSARSRGAAAPVNASRKWIEASSLAIVCLLRIVPSGCPLRRFLFSFFVFDLYHCFSFLFHPLIVRKWCSSI